MCRVHSSHVEFTQGGGSYKPHTPPPLRLKSCHRTRSAEERPLTVCSGQIPGQIEARGVEGPAVVTRRSGRGGDDLQVEAARDGGGGGEGHLLKMEVKASDLQHIRDRNPFRVLSDAEIFSRLKPQRSEVIRRGTILREHVVTVLANG